MYQRHVVFFLDSDRADKDGSGRPDVGLGLAVSLKARKDPVAMLSVSQYNLPTLREDLAEEVSRLADKLNGLGFVSLSTLLRWQVGRELTFGLHSQTQKNVGPSYAYREAFVGMVTRRLQDVLLLGANTA